MPLPENFFEDDENYRIRLCMLVDDADPNWVVPGSKVNPCDSCGALIWVNESQVIPDLPEGMELSGDVAVCKVCAAYIGERATEGVEWAGTPPPQVVIEDVKKYFGLG
jgi:hypothetical protein